MSGILSLDEVLELAAALTDLLDDYESGNVTDVEIEESIRTYFGIDLYAFSRVANALANYTSSWKSPLSGKLYKGFVDEKRGSALAKIDISESQGYLKTEEARFADNGNHLNPCLITERDSATETSKTTGEFDGIRDAHNADIAEKDKRIAELEAKVEYQSSYVKNRDGAPIGFMRKERADVLQRRIEEYRERIKELEAELSDLREDADDLRVLTEQLVHEPCEDAVHCSCVPLLRKKIKELEEKLKTTEDLK